MIALEIALVILVVLWSIIFLIIAVGLFVLFWKFKKGADKINTILDNVSSPLSKAIMGAAYLKDALSSVVKIKKNKK